jgi:predicted nuclease of predicted toxin-antitoxin system
VSEALDDVRFLLDVNVGRTVKEFLENEGYDVSWMAEIDPRMDDTSILSLAVAEKRVLITVDKDFGDLIFNQGFAHAGVIRLEDTFPHVQVQYLRTLLKEHGKELLNRMIVLDSGRIRIRFT